MMSDPVQIVFIGVIPAILTGVASILTAISLFRKIKAVDIKVDEYHREVNSKMSQLLEVTGDAREAQGKEKERIKYAGQGEDNKEQVREKDRRDIP